MGAEEIPDAVKRLIADSIESVPELEAILLLREERHRSWSAVEAGQRLYVSTTMAGHVLSVLVERGFFARSKDTFRYAPVTPQLEATVDQLATSYSRSLIAVTTAIHSRPSKSVRQFADAFRLKKED